MLACEHHPFVLLPFPLLKEIPMATAKKTTKKQSPADAAPAYKMSTGHTLLCAFIGMMIARVIIVAVRYWGS